MENQTIPHLKILLAIDPLNPDRDALDFASFLTRLTGSAITGVCLENEMERRSYAAGTGGFINRVPVEHQGSNIESTVPWLKGGGEAAGAILKLHRNRGVPVDELAIESRFADLLLINRNLSLNGPAHGGLSALVTDLLLKAECPVLITPLSFEAIDELIFMYDGTPSSVFAIKQFTYLLPGLNNRNVVVVQVNKEGVLKDIHKYVFNEWLKDHYRHVTFKAIAGEPEKEMFSFLVERRNSFVVMGAYGKWILSVLPLKSKAEVLVKLLKHPVFIAHR